MFWHCGDFIFDTRMPVIMGILNVTPDSFSDGGVFADAAGTVNVDAAVAAARAMVEAGAKIIDVGGESTRPGHEPVPVEVEAARVTEVVRRLASEGICVSIDTRHAQVAAAALAAGAAIVNDITGFEDPAMAALVSAPEATCGVVVMHCGAGAGASFAKTAGEGVDVVAAVADYLRDRAAALEAVGVAKNRICVDPGPGFGKDPSETLMVVRNFQEFRHLGYPVCCAVSRKRFIGEAYGIPEAKDRDAASAQEALMAAELGCGVLRVHNVEATVEALKNLRPYCVLALGCNVALVGGDTPEELTEAKKAQLSMAIGDLCVLPDTTLIDVAPFFGSEPAYYEDQDTFVNTAVLIRTGIAPHELLDYLHAIENKLGRVRSIANGPRTCDIDILDYQTYICDDEVLTLPHPRICERDFVVKPFEAILPGHVLANGRKVACMPEAERTGRAWLLR